MGVAWEDGHLFDVAGLPEVVPAEVTPLSDTRRRTLLNNQLLAGGIHPVSGYHLLDKPGFTCGMCAHRDAQQPNRRIFYKCDLVPATNGLATDIRLSWPACTRFERST